MVLSAVCLSLWAAALVEATNARYVTRTAGSVSVRVASFLVETGEPVLSSADGIIDCNLDDDCVTYAFAIRNRSEVVVDYQVHAEGAADSVNVSIGNASGSLLSNGGETVVTLSFSAKDPTDRTQSLSVGNVTVTVTAVQKGDGT